MNTAPIIVFAYNRPNHLRKTLTWLGQNELASQSTLYIFCDGPKPNSTDEQLAKVQAARKVAHEVAVVPTFKEVHILERTENLGLGTSVITGVTEIINKYGKVIVLEDDLETSPYLLSYMNQCLDHYEARKSVFSISGLSRPHPERFYPADYLYDVYVSLTHHPTGWATWADRWNQVDWNVDLLDVVKKDPQMIKAFRRAEYGQYDELLRLNDQQINLWAARFAFAHFVNHAVSICPIVSYINHIGWDAEATNATSSTQWNFERLADNANIRFLDVLYEDSRIINSWYSFSMPQRRTLWGRLKNWYGRKFLHRDEYALKGRVYAE
jgi:hypothetical protein